MRIRLLVAAICIVGSALPAPAQPEARWTWHTAAPLITQLTAAETDPGTRGLEVLVVNPSAGTLVALDRTGGVLWTYGGGFTDTPAAGPAVSAVQLEETPLVALAAGGTLHVVDGATGTPRWTEAVPGLQAGTALWADVDGDTWHDVVAVTDTGVVAYTSLGEPLWTFDGTLEAEPLAPRGLLAAADLEGDGMAELLGIAADGLYCIERDGLLRWRIQSDTTYTGAPIVLDRDNDTFPELYVAAAQPAMLAAYEAEFGDPLWRVRLTGAANGETRPIAADFQGAGRFDIALNLATGTVQVADGAEGGWGAALHREKQAFHVAADVTGDGTPEIVAATAPGTLAAVGATQAAWSFDAGAQFVSPPVVADLDEDGALEVVGATVTGSVVCLSTAGRVGPAWAQARANAQQTGAWLPDPDAMPLLDADAALGQVSGPANGDFETPPVGDGPPPGWLVERGPQDAAQTVGDPVAAGQGAMLFDPRGEVARISSEELAVDSGTRNASAVAFAQGEDPEAVLRWRDLGGVLREDPLEPGNTNADGWTRYQVDNALPPRGATRVGIVLRSAGGATTWDNIRLTLNVAGAPDAGVFVNQVGYNLGGPMRFTAWSSVDANEASFELVNKNGDVVRRGTLGLGDRIVGYHGNTWDHYYYRGDFTGYEGTGVHTVRVQIGEVSAESHRFLIDRDVLWKQLAELLTRPLLLQRCPSDMDDFKGWWASGATDDCLPAAALWHYARAYEIAAWRWERMDADADGTPDYLGLLLEHTGALIAQAEAMPATDPELPQLVGALARIARVGQEVAPELHERVVPLFERAKEAHPDSIYLFAAAIDFLVLTQDAMWRPIVESFDQGPDPRLGEAQVFYDGYFFAAHNMNLAMTGEERFAPVLARADNPFGLAADGERMQPRYFPLAPDGQPKGNTAYILTQALDLMAVYRFNPQAPWRDFAYDQLNWLLGNNPYGLSMLGGAGSTSVPSWRHQALLGAAGTNMLEGAVARGIAARAANDDRPDFDRSGVDLPAAHTNGTDLVDAARLLELVAQIHRLRTSGNT